MSNSTQKILLASAIALASASASASVYQDKNGNVGYSTMDECNQAIANGTAKFYQSYTRHRPKRRSGEASVRTVKLSQISAKYANGSCDRGTGRRSGRDGVARAIQGKYIPFSANMPVNVYLDAKGQPVRVSMAQCDNWFSGSFPTPFVKPYVAPVVKPKPVYVPKPKPVVVPKPAVQAAEAATAATTSNTGIGVLPILGAVAAAGIAAAIISNDSTNCTGKSCD